jgi:hypothetical protein
MHSRSVAAELDDRAVSGALDDAAVMCGDGGIDEIAAEPPGARAFGPRQLLLAASSRRPRNQDRCELSGLAHCAPPAVGGLAQMPARVCLYAGNF